MEGGTHVRAEICERGADTKEGLEGDSVSYEYCERFELGCDFEERKGWRDGGSFPPEEAERDEGRLEDGGEDGEGGNPMEEEVSKAERESGWFQ